MSEGWVAGAWDVHVHCAPSLFPRRGDGHDLVAACAEAGMEGVVIKAHHGSSVEMAAALDRASSGPRVLGGMVLNDFVGGLSPLAVEASVALGARIVWLPTIHAAHHAEVMGMLGGFTFQKRELRHTPTQGIRIIGAGGELVEPMQRILDVLDGTAVVLATGHVSAAEIFALRRGIVDRGLDVRLLVNHVLFEIPRLDDEQVSALVGDDVWLELCAFTVLHGLDVRRVAAVVRAHENARWILASDSGQTTTPPAPEALGAFCAAMHEAGVAEERIRRAVRDEPGLLVGA